MLEQSQSLDYAGGLTLKLEQSRDRGQTGKNNFPECLPPVPAFSSNVRFEFHTSQAQTLLRSSNSTALHGLEEFVVGLGIPQLIQQELQ